MIKCFEAINLLEFNELQEVCGMISPEKELVTFTKKIDVNDGEKKGNVEIWLSEIEREMRTTLKKISQLALEDPVKRTDWVTKYQAMIVLMGNMIRWSSETEDALRNKLHDSKSVQKLLQQLSSELSEIVVKVRGNLSELDRLTLGALVHFLF